MCPPVVDIVARLSPFSAETVHCEMPSGLTVSQMLTGIAGPVSDQPGFIACIDGRPIPTEWLHRVKPRAGRTVTVHVVLHDGGGGKNTVRTVATIAVVAAALVVGPMIGAALFGVSASTAVLGGVTAGGIGTALVGTAGLLAVNAVAPPRTPQIGSAAPAALSTTSGTAQGTRDSPNYSIAGARNRLQPFGPVPAPLGRHRMVPPLGARTYTEILGGEQYLRMLLVWGYGPLRISDLRIGETPLSSFAGVTVETLEGRETDPPRSLFPAVVFQQPLSITLANAAGWQSRTTDPDVDEISIDVTFPAGLLEIAADGSRQVLQVDIAWQTRPAGSSTWTAQPSLSARRAQNSAVRIGARVAVARGQYDVRLRRATADRPSVSVQDTAVWTALRGTRNEDPIQFAKPLATTTLRVKASNQLGGTVDQVSGIVECECLDWDGQDWVLGYTSNPASLFRHVLQHPANAQPVTDAQIDLAALQDWHAFCAAEGFTFNHIRDFSDSGGGCLDDIAAAGRARKSITDGKWTVIVDRRKTVITQMFTPFNSWAFQGTKVFGQTPHGWRVDFIDETDDRFRRDERIVYDDGYDASNATLFEALEMTGVTNPDQIWKQGREHIAVGRLRPESFTLNVGVENLIATAGDLVAINHDVILAGISAGRVKSVIDDGEQPPVNAIGVVVDQRLEMEEGQSYALAFRKPDDAAPGRASVLTRAIQTVAGEQSEGLFVDPIPLAQGPQAGDLYSFGTAESTYVEQVIKSIEPASEMTARLVLVDHAPAIFDAGSGVIPPYDSQITIPPDAGLEPATPRIESIQSDISVAVRADDGSLVDQIIVTTDPPTQFDPAEVALEAQIRLVGSTAYGESVTQGQSTQVIISDVIGGETYDLRFRRVAAASSAAPGAVSDWIEETNYTVIGKTAPPADIGPLRFEDPVVRWEYDPPLDFKGYLVRYHRGQGQWSDATPAHDGFLTVNRFDITQLRDGAFTFLVKAIDTGLRQSVNAASLLIDTGDPFVENIIFEEVYRDFDFGLFDGRGTVTGGQLIDGDLQADDLVLFWGANPDARFWSETPGAQFWNSVFAEMTYVARFTPQADHVSAIITLQTTIQGQAHTITYRLPNSSDSAWRAWPGKLRVANTDPIEFRIIITSATVRGIISEFTVLIDVPDVVELLNDVEIDAAGTRLPITKTYRSIVNVSLTVVEQVADAIAGRVIDKDATQGPLVECVNRNNQSIDGQLDARVQGY